MSDTMLFIGLMLVLLGIYSWGFYMGVDSERRRARKDKRGGG